MRNLGKLKEHEKITISHIINNKRNYSCFGQYQRLKDLRLLEDRSFYDIEEKFKLKQLLFNFKKYSDEEDEIEEQEYVSEKIIKVDNVNDLFGENFENLLNLKGFKNYSNIKNKNEYVKLANIPRKKFKILSKSITSVVYR